MTNCQPKSVHIPTQELLHRKKCLLPDGAQEAGKLCETYILKTFDFKLLPVNDYGAPADDPLPTYSATPQPNYG